MGFNHFLAKLFCFTLVYPCAIPVADPEFLIREALTKREDGALFQLKKF